MRQKTLLPDSFLYEFGIKLLGALATFLFTMLFVAGMFA